MTTITSSNGYSLRPLIEADYSFVMEVLKDFPIGSNSYAQRVNEFSTMLYVTEGFTVAKVKAQTPTAVTMITVKDSVARALCYLDFASLVAEQRIAAVHPDHRGGKHFTAQQMLAAYLAYTECDCTSSMQEAISSGGINTVANKWRSTMSTAETERETIDKSGDGTTYTLKKIIQTAAEHETYRAAHSTWGSVTYTVS
jgi:hypothetical protein